MKILFPFLKEKALYRLNIEYMYLNDKNTLWTFKKSPFPPEKYGITSPTQATVRVL